MRRERRFDHVPQQCNSPITRLEDEGQPLAELPQLTSTQAGCYAAWNQNMAACAQLDQKCVALRAHRPVGHLSSTLGQEARRTPGDEPEDVFDPLIPVPTQPRSYSARGDGTKILPLLGRRRSAEAPGKPRVAEEPLRFACLCATARPATRVASRPLGIRPATTGGGDDLRRRRNQQGDFLESLNLACVQRGVFVNNNNQWAISVPRSYPECRAKRWRTKALGSGLPASRDAMLLAVLTGQRRR